jgi:hypothetical protein
MDIYRPILGQCAAPGNLSFVLSQSSTCKGRQSRPRRDSVRMSVCGHIRVVQSYSAEQLHGCFLPTLQYRVYPVGLDGVIALLFHHAGVTICPRLFCGLLYNKYGILRDTECAPSWLKLGFRKLDEIITRCSATVLLPKTILILVSLSEPHFDVRLLPHVCTYRWVCCRTGFVLDDCVPVVHHLNLEIQMTGACSGSTRVVLGAPFPTPSFRVTRPTIWDTTLSSWSATVWRWYSSVNGRGFHVFCGLCLLWSVVFTFLLFMCWSRGALIVEPFAC